ncbi:MAG: InlB B-repeat-containing protein [Defluviitaleaceae bacterium]|nr:InlB B-repeat-containing protein [Defluviitaleaceae bacterium]
MRTGHIFTGWDVIVGATVNILTGVISGGTIYQSGLTHDDVADWPITENIVFRAMWEPIEELIEILFDSNGGVTPNRTVTIPDGNSVMGSVREGYVEWPSIPERPGYVFLGWYTAIDPVTNEGTGRRLHNATPVYYQHPQSFIISSNARLMGLQPIQAQGPQNPATLTVYARWIPMAPVTFDSNGAGAADVTINYPVGYDAYTAGWIRRDTAGRIYDAFGPHSMHSIPSAERANQVPLRFSQSLNHLAMGGMSGGNAWHHAVWNTEPDGTGYSFGRSTVVTGPMTVYATWTGIVTFNNNHNRFSNASNSVMRRQVISGQSVHSNNIMELMFGVGSSPEHQVWNTLHRNNSPYNSEILTTQAQMPLQNIMPCHDDAGWAAFQLPGFAFLGWYTHPVYRNPEYRFTADTIVTENIQVFAHWADAIVLNIGGAASHANGIAWLGVDDQGNPNTVRRLYGAEVTNPALSLSDQGIDVSLLVPPTWPGRTFWHWNTSPCGGGFAIDAHTPILDFFVLYAIWHVDVVFHPGAGVFASSIQNYPIGTPTYWHPVQVAGRPPSDTFNINNVTKENWRFHHWNEDPVPGSATGDPYLHSTPIYGLNTGRLNLHAQFAGRVTFDFNITGASYNSMTPPPSPIDILQNRTANGEQEGSITNPNFPDPALVTHPHYTFQGWNTEPDGTGTWFNETTVMTMGDITVYGIWRGNMFNLTVSNSPSGLTHIGQTGVLGGATTTNLDPVVGTHNVQSGRGVTLTAGTVAGYTFIGWYRGTTPPADFDNIPAGNLVTTNVYAFPMPAADVSYIALWRRNPIVGVTINATKRVEGADAPAFNFGFTLTQVVDNLGSAVSPNAITGTSTANTTGGADSFPFSFDLEGLVADTYFFRIEETTVDTRQGWTNDLEPRIVTVTLFGEGNEREATVTGWNNSQTFTNTFQTPTANVTINATKRVAGENAPDFEFGFTLTQVANAAGDAFEGTAITDTVMRNTTGAGNEDFNFTINGLVAGTYFFRIQERYMTQPIQIGATIPPSVS